MSHRVAGVLAAAVALVATGCGSTGLVDATADRSNGKEQFTAKCGSCHTLADAGTQGRIGPNLDDAFVQSRADGYDESTIAAIGTGILTSLVLFAINWGIFAMTMGYSQDIANGRAMMMVMASVKSIPIRSKASGRAYETSCAPSAA